MTTSFSPKVGLVLSGGAARGIAHIGVLQAFKELGIPIHMIAGTSMGAIVGTFWAAGIPPLGMREILHHDRRLIERFRWRWQSGGLLNMGFLHDMLDEYIGRPSFEELSIPLYLAATNLNSGQTAYFHQGPLYQAVAASAAIPVVFSPQVIDGQTYVDGGLTNNLPVDPLRDQCDVIIGVHVNYQEDLHQVEGIWEIASRCFSMAIYQTVLSQRGRCDLLIEPPETRAFALFDFDKVDALYQTGYQAVQTLIKEGEPTLLSLRQEP